jgi:hypothetical protein
MSGPQHAKRANATHQQQAVLDNPNDDDEMHPPPLVMPPLRAARPPLPPPPASSTQAPHQQPRQPFGANAGSDETPTQVGRCRSQDEDSFTIEGEASPRSGEPDLVPEGGGTTVATGRALSDEEPEDEEAEAAFNSAMGITTLSLLGDTAREAAAAAEAEDHTSLFIFTRQSKVRQFCMVLHRSLPFRVFILVSILINAVMLALDEPGRDKADHLEILILVSDILFTVIFVCEMMVKIIALGFVLHKGSFLRDSWNRFDLFVTAMSLLGIIIGSSATNFSTLRVFRVLRPLRSLQRIRPLKTLIGALFDAIPEVGNNLLLFAFILIVFAINGVVLFAGDLTQRCYAVEYFGDAPPRPENMTWENLSLPLLIRDDAEICGGTRSCPNLTLDYGVRSECLGIRELYYRRNLNFDQLISGSLLTLKVMTLDNWNEDLADEMNASGQTSSIWFVALTFLGAFICVNLFLAILTQAYHNRVVENAKEDGSSQVTEEMLDSFYATLKQELANRSASRRDSTTEANSDQVLVFVPSMGPSRGASFASKRVDSRLSQHNSDRANTATTSTPVPLASDSPPDSPLRGGSTPPRTSSTLSKPKTSFALNPRFRTASSVISATSRLQTGPSLRTVTLDDGDVFELKTAKGKRRQRGSAHKTLQGSRSGAINEDGGEEMDAQALELGRGLDPDDIRRDRRRRAIDREIDEAVTTALAAQAAEQDAQAFGHGFTCARVFGVDDDDIIEDRDGDDRAPWRKRFAKIMDSVAMQGFMTLVTLLNVVSVAWDYHGIDPDTLAIMDTISVVCTGIYVVNLALVILGEGFARTFSSGFNVLDLLVILISIPDIVVTSGSSTAWGVFRIFRLLRLLRFLRIRRLQPLVRTIIDSVSSIGYLSLLILLFLYVFAITGMQIFGTDYGAYEPTERNKFATIWQSAITTFVAMSGDRWTDLMRVGMQSYTNGGEVLPVTFFVIVYMVGNYILINLSVAIILDNLESKLAILDDADEELHPPLLFLPVCPTPPKKARLANDTEVRSTVHNSPTSRRKMSTFASVVAPVSPSMDNILGHNSALIPEIPSTGLSPGHSPRGLTPGSRVASSLGSPRQPPPQQDVLGLSVMSNSNDLNSPGSSAGPDKVVFADTIRVKESSFKTRLRRVKAYLSYVRPVIVEGNSFFVFSEKNPFRQALATIASSTLFDRCIDFIILVNILFLLFESPYNSDGLQSTLRNADYAFTCVFLAEMLIKMIAFGVFTPGPDRHQVETGFAIQEAYFRDFWNWVDFIVVASSIAAYFAPIFRASRALRSLRLMTRFETTRIIILALVQAIPHVLHGLVFVGFVFFVLGVMGVKFFKGRYYQCNDSTVLDKRECIGYFTNYVQGPVFQDPEIIARSWDRFAFHFDHLGSALLTLFVVMVGDGWGEIMFQGMDTDADEDWGLQENQRAFMSLYFVTVFITCHFFALNMMIGILVSYFAKKKRLHDGSALLTPAQRMYVKARYAIDATVDEVLVPKDFRVAQVLHEALTYRHPRLSKETSVFDICMMTVIIINTVMIASTHEGMPSTLDSAIDIVNNVALALFTLEAGVKLVTYGFTQYFSLGWNCFDFAIVIVGIIGAIVDLPGLSVFRVLRILKMIKGSGVERLIISLVRGLSSFINVTVLLVLTFFVFAVAGVILFGRVKYHGALTVNYNFRNVPNAMLTLYTVATGAGWAEVMDACALEPPDCDPNVDDCGSLPAAVAFFVIFMVVCAFVVVQLFVAVVVEIFLDDVNHNDPVIAAFATMRAQWTARFGPGVRSVSVQEFAEFVKELPPALTDFNWDPTRSDVVRLLSALNLPIDSQFNVQYIDSVNALAFRKFRVDIRGMAKYLKDTVVSVFGRTAFSATQAYAILIIQRAWRKRKAYLNEVIAPLVGISTTIWAERVEARRERKRQEAALGGVAQRSDSLHLVGMMRLKPLPSFTEESAAFVPTGGITVPGSMLYAFPMAELHGVAGGAPVPASTMDDFGRRLQQQANQSVAGASASHATDAPPPHSSVDGTSGLPSPDGATEIGAPPPPGPSGSWTPVQPAMHADVQEDQPPSLAVVDATESPTHAAEQQGNPVATLSEPEQSPCPAPGTTQNSGPVSGDGHSHATNSARDDNSLPAMSFEGNFGDRAGRRQVSFTFDREPQRPRVVSGRSPISPLGPLPSSPVEPAIIG